MTAIASYDLAHDDGVRDRRDLVEQQTGEGSTSAPWRCASVWRSPPDRPRRSASTDGSSNGKAARTVALFHRAQPSDIATDDDVLLDGREGRFVDLPGPARCHRQPGDAAGRRGDRRPIEQDVAASGSTSPTMPSATSTSGAIGPDDRHGLTLRQRWRSMPNSAWKSPYADIELIDAKQLAHCAPGARWSARSSPRYSHARLAGCHHFVWIALDQLTAGVDRHHTVDDAQQGVHDVLDPHDRHPPCGSA